MSSPANSVWIQNASLCSNNSSLSLPPLDWRTISTLWNLKEQTPCLAVLNHPATGELAFLLWILLLCSEHLVFNLRFCFNKRHLTHRGHFKKQTRRLFTQWRLVLVRFFICTLSKMYLIWLSLDCWSPSEWKVPAGSHSCNLPAVRQYSILPLCSPDGVIQQTFLQLLLAVSW